MKKIVQLLILLFLPMFLFCQYSDGWVDYSEDPVRGDPSTIERSWDGYWINPQSKMRLLTIFIEVIYDVNPAKDPFYESTAKDLWDTVKIVGVNRSKLPGNPKTFLDLEYKQGQNQGSMTRRFGESSFDVLQLTGDFIIVILKESAVLKNYEGEFSERTISNEAFSMINVQGVRTAYGHNSIKDYDGDNDSVVDFVQVVIRNITNEYGGSSNGSGWTSSGMWVGNSLKFGSDYYPLGKGSVQCQHGDLGSEPCSIVQHEFAHSLFGGNNFHTSGGNHRGSSEFMPFLSVQAGYGLMGASGTSLLSCNGYERWRMHWKHPNSVDYISACNASGQSIVSDVSKADGTQTFILRDFVTYGDVVRIKLPYKDSDFASNQYIWLENHQVGYNNKLDVLQYGGDECRPEATDCAGIYAYYQIGRDVLEGTYSQVWDRNERDNLKMIPAEGYWDYQVENVPQFQYGCVNFELYTHKHVRVKENPFCGYQDQEMQVHPVSMVNLNSIPKIRKKEYFVNGVLFENSYLPELGDELDVFSKKTKIGMSTNPSTCNAKTFYNYLTNSKRYNYTEQSYRNNDKTYLSGLSIEMTPIGDGSSWKVVIRWDDYNITTSANWTGRVVLKEKAAVTSGTTVKLQQNRTPARFFKDASTNLFDLRSSLTCESGSVFRLKAGSRLELLENSTLLLKSGSKFIIEDGGVLFIQKGSKIEAEGCSHVVIEGKGYIQTENGTGVNFLEGSMLTALRDDNIRVPENGRVVSQIFASLGQFYGNSVSGNITMGNNKITNDISVKSGNHLTVTGELNFAQGCGITVEQGAKLTVNGGKLTGSCNGGLWKGIEILGTDDKTQTGDYFGLVTLNNAIIENAEVGVLTAKRNSDFHLNSWTDDVVFNDPIVNNSFYQVVNSGGRLIATNSIFRNNKRAIEFSAYSKSNSSVITGCVFEINNPIGDISDFMVGINKASNIKILGCKFIVDESLPNVVNSKIKGIRSINSSFSIYPECKHQQNGLMHTTPWCPSATEDKYNKFENLYYGIYATGVGGPPTFGIKFASFTNTRRGIYASGVDNVSITDCKFDIPGYKMSSYPGADEPVYNYGIYCNGSTNYQIEGNIFEGVYGKLISMDIQPWCYGVILNNSGNSANRIYNNSFKGLEVAAQAQGENRNPQTGVGLCFSCNDFESNKTDIAVTANAVDPKNSIAKFQYNKSGRPAANGFSPDSDSKHQWDMFSYENGPLVTYFTFKENADGRKYIMTKYTKATFVNPNTGIIQENMNVSSQGHSKECPRTPYQSGGGVIGVGGGSGGLLTLQSSVQSSENSLSSAVDKGGNAQLINQITSATQNDSGQLRAVLSDNSPYLSEEAVIKTIENFEAVNSVMLRDVLVNNSHAIREKAVINSLENRSNPLPEYMNEQILAASNRLSGLDLLKIDLQHNSVEYGSLLNGMIQSYQNTDSLAIVNELLEQGIDDNLKSGYALYNASIGNKDKAEELILSIENSDNGLLELIEVFNDSLYDGNADSTTINKLQLLSNQENRFGIIANNILNDLGVIEYEEPVYPIEYTNLKTVSQDKEKLTAKTVDYLTVYPNPVKDYLTIEYNGEGLSDNLTLIINKIDGKHIKTINLEHTVDSIAINVSKFEKGSYIVSLTSEGYIVQSQKFIVE